MPLITLLTPTGWRKKAFSLTESYVKRQTYKGDIQWLVSSDDKLDDPTPCTMGQEYYPCPLTWKLGINTQRYQFANLIPHIKGEYVFVWEDDDLYKPQYLEIMMDFLKYGDVVGESDVTYYNLARRGFKEMNNHRHASLCQTGFKRSYLPHFENAVHSGQVFFDLSLWGNARAKGHKSLLFSGMNLLVGLKGIERSGIGFGHTASNEEFTADPNFIKLKQLLGIDANPYIEMFK
jgi:hypothetical protein